jgi:uncharacterized membrane protein YkgB
MLLPFFRFAASLQEVGTHLCRVGLIIVLVWIGSLKFAAYEAVGIVPFVANSPVMSFFYHYQPPAYRAHLNKEGEWKPANVAWHQTNLTYAFSNILGSAIVLIGVMIALYPLSPAASAVGSLLCFGMSLVTLSFLVTTPEVWVPPLGDAQHGFPYLSGAGRLVLKDIIMMGASLATMAQAARTHLISRPRLNLIPDTHFFF